MTHWVENREQIRKDESVFRKKPEKQIQDSYVTGKNMSWNTQKVIWRFEERKEQKELQACELIQEKAYICRFTSEQQKQKLHYHEPKGFLPKKVELTKRLLQSSRMCLFRVWNY